MVGAEAKGLWGTVAVLALALVVVSAALVCLLLQRGGAAEGGGSAVTLKAAEVPGVSCTACTPDDIAVSGKAAKKRRAKAAYAASSVSGGGQGGSATIVAARVAATPVAKALAEVSSDSGASSEQGSTASSRCHSEADEAVEAVVVEARKAAKAATREIECRQHEARLKTERKAAAEARAEAEAIRAEAEALRAEATAAAEAIAAAAERETAAVAAANVAAAAEARFITRAAAEMPQSPLSSPTPPPLHEAQQHTVTALDVEGVPDPPQAVVPVAVTEPLLASAAPLAAAGTANSPALGAPTAASAAVERKLSKGVVLNPLSAAATSATLSTSPPAATTTHARTPKAKKAKSFDYSKKYAAAALAKRAEAQRRASNAAAASAGITAVDEPRLAPPHASRSKTLPAPGAGLESRPHSATIGASPAAALRFPTPEQWNPASTVRPMMVASAASAPLPQAPSHSPAPGDGFSGFEAEDRLAFETRCASSFGPGGFFGGVGAVASPLEAETDDIAGAGTPFGSRNARWIDSPVWTPPSRNGTNGSAPALEPAPQATPPPCGGGAALAPSGHSFNMPMESFIPEDLLGSM